MYNILAFVKMNAEKKRSDVQLDEEEKSFYLEVYKNSTQKKSICL